MTPQSGMGACREPPILPLRQNPRRRAFARPIRTDRDPEGAASGKRILCELRSADARAKRQARLLAQSAPLRPEGVAHNEGDAVDHRARLRSQTRPRALQSDARTGDGSAAARRNLIPPPTNVSASPRRRSHVKKRRSSRRSRSFALPASTFPATRLTSAATGHRTPSRQVRVSATAN
jgi:hypothetical protein